ncbi:MAG: hypothetical protein JOZ94_04655, partial [Xanthobacteraceae bacterium]|nr:hypothetical protein [Xanthobacteraceae bacterium]
MANSSQTSKERTEQEVLLAIEQALNLRDFDQAPERGEASASSEPVAPSFAAPPVTIGAPVAAPHSSKHSDNFFADNLEQALRLPRIDDPLIEPPAGGRESEEPVQRAANDDRENIGQLLRALQARPSGRPYLYAFVFTAVWAVVLLGLAFGTFGDAVSEAFHAGVGAWAPLMLGLLAAFAVPVGFAFVLANMLRRSHELRLVGQSMAEIAMRLAEPEHLARDSIVNVSQAVRREVAAMGDGVERALARAAELEGLVNGEIATLERAYTENEVRIRGLLDTIATQRDTLISHAAEVKSAINSVHLDLSSEIGSISEMIANQVHHAAERVTASLTERGEEVTQGLRATADNMITELGERSGELLMRLEQASETTARSIEAAAERMTQSLSLKEHNIEEEFLGIADNIQRVMRDRLDTVADEFSQKSISVLDTMDQHSRTITDALLDTSSNLTETIANRVDEVNNTLRATGDSLVLDLSLRGGDVVSKLEQTGASIAETLLASGSQVSETFEQHANELASSVAARSDAVHDLLTDRLANFEGIFTRNGGELADRIAHDSE